MLENRLYISGEDVFAAYGVYLVQGSWNELVTWPVLKNVVTTSWPEEDGVEADLTAACLDTRELTVRMAFTSLTGLGAFVDMLSTGHAAKLWTDNVVGIGFMLRLVSASSMDYARRLGYVSLRLADDFPQMRDMSHRPASRLALPPTGYELATPDGPTDLARYGVRVLRGTRAELSLPAPVKKALLRNVKTLPGAIYDAEAPVVVDGQDVRLYLLMRAVTVDELWTNYYALLHDVSGPSGVGLTYDGGGRTLRGYYKSQTVTSLYTTGRIWLEMTLTITRTGGDLRLPATADVLLFTENDVMVVAADGRAIDVA